ncbi:hypothetical protein GUJ93_ZPchr0003g16456 [Zizania palustris]|uniref:Uncharacterized protein n=1 Tax=Zizania palustris TaxID=103762 RepID=A0A8J5VCV4_ZIZPA|nr:hypothetical protein GUJ93_ZPchr0003g16456 [Zizania palustris]
MTPEGRDWWCGGGRRGGGWRVEDGVGRGDAEADDPGRPRLTTRRRRRGGWCVEEDGVGRSDTEVDGVERPRLAARRRTMRGRTTSGGRD